MEAGPHRVEEAEKEADSSWLPDGIAKEDLVKADPPHPLYLSDQHQVTAATSVDKIDLYQAQAEAAIARLELAKSQQQVAIRDILVEMGVTNRTHQVSRDQSGRYFAEKLKA